MEVVFLGTCACDYSPKLKDEFLNSFDFDARRSSCLLLDGQYLIDCGEHGLDSLRIAGVEYDAISDIFISHLHTDHFNAQHRLHGKCNEFIVPISHGASNGILVLV